MAAKDPIKVPSGENAGDRAPDAPLRPWASPSVRPLAAGSAEFSSNNQADNEGMS